MEIWLHVTCLHQDCMSIVQAKVRLFAGANGRAASSAWDAFEAAPAAAPAAAPTDDWSAFAAPAAPPVPAHAAHSDPFAALAAPRAPAAGPLVEACQMLYIT